MATSTIKYIKQNYLLTGGKTSSSDDCNNFESWSAYMCSSNVKNVPLTGSWAMVFTIWSYGTFNKMQIGLSVGSTKKLYHRYYDNGAWTSWVAAD